MGELSTLTYLTENLHQEEKKRCYEVFIKNKFLAYDYDKKKFGSPDILLSDKYTNRDRVRLRYKTEDLVFSASKEDDFIISLIDGNNSNSEIILDLSDDFARILSNLKFSYIDNNGDIPKYLDDKVNKLLPGILFKYNYFGLDYINKYGKDFFENFPAVNIKYITENTIRIDLVDNVFGSVSKKLQKQIIEYLQGYNITDVYFYNSDDYMIF